MSTTPPTITQLSDLLTPQQIQDLDQADLRPNGYRHPTWFALHNPKPRAIDHLVHKAIPLIARQAGGDAWLRDLAPRLNDFNDDRNASSSLAEIRAYGGLLEAGFQVKPIVRTSDATPDFTVDAGDGPVTVEVFSKHQDEDQDDLVAAVNTPDRFRLTNKKSRLSAVLFVFHEAVVLLENPWADKPLPPRARFAFGRYPWFNLPYSIADWHTGNTLAIVEAQRRMIEAFDV